MNRSGDTTDPAYSGADSGCHLHPLCLKCPLEVCVYDRPRRSSPRALVLADSSHGPQTFSHSHQVRGDSADGL